MHVGSHTMDFLKYIWSTIYIIHNIQVCIRYEHNVLNFRINQKSISIIIFTLTFLRPDLLEREMGCSDASFCFLPSFGSGQHSLLEGLLIPSSKLFEKFVSITLSTTKWSSQVISTNLDSPSCSTHSFSVERFVWSSLSTCLIPCFNCGVDGAWYLSLSTDTSSLCSLFWMISCFIPTFSKRIKASSDFNSSFSSLAPALNACLKFSQSHYQKTSKR